MNAAVPMLQSSSTLAALCALFASASAASICSSGCSGHGDCGLGGACACKSPWAGLDCSFFLSISGDTEQGRFLASRSTTCSEGCSGRGRCVSGTCICREGFYGPTCADAQCADNCFNHGTCLQGTCLCSSGWAGQKCEMSLSQDDRQDFALASMPARGGADVDDLMRDLYAGDNTLSAQAASRERPRTEPEKRDPRHSASLLGYQKAARATKAVWEVADQLYAAAARENKNDASRRIKRAIADARQNFEQLPGHEFGSKPSASGILLAQRTKLNTTLCGAGCGSHGSCDGKTGQCQCADSWTGASCDVKRCPDDCSGGGMCITGRCVCDPQRFGASCQHERCPDDCSGHGYCFNGRCQCSGTFGGENCLLQVHSSSVVRFKLAKKQTLTNGLPKELSSLRASDAAFTSQRSRALSQFQTTSTLEQSEEQQCAKGCSKRGSCIRGSCLCYSGYQGSDCSIMGACSAHGTPKASLLASKEGETTCSCDPGWTGPDCNMELVCPDQSCSGHGICNYGRCTCAAGYSGHSCHVSLVQRRKRQAQLSDLPTHKPSLLSASTQANSSSKPQKADSGDASDSPMTVSWLQPAKFVQPALNSVMRSASDSTPRATAALPVEDDLLWHPAAPPPAGASSILNMLATKVEEGGKAAWAERPLESPLQGRRQQPPMPRKLASLLALSPSTAAVATRGEQLGRSSDIDSLVGDI